MLMINYIIKRGINETVRALLVEKQFFKAINYTKYLFKYREIWA